MTTMQTINLSIDLPAEFDAVALANAIRDAAERAAGQIEHGILPFPLPMDETIPLGSSVEGVESVLLYRSE